MKDKLRAINDFILLKMLKEQTATAGGLILPGNANDEKPYKGEVISIGKYAKMISPLDGKSQTASELAIGDVVLFPRSQGLKITDATTETPGLGTNVLREEWQKHWAGKDESYEFDKSKDGFAGATISPKGVYTGIKATLKDFKSISVSQK